MKKWIMAAGLMMALVPQATARFNADQVVDGYEGQATTAEEKADPKTKTSTVQFIWLEDLDLSNISTDGTTPKKGKTFTDKPINLGGKTYKHGVGTSARSHLAVDLKGMATQFVTTVGCTGGEYGSISFEIWLDGRKVADSGIMRAEQSPKTFSIDLTDAQKMTLKVTAAKDFKHHNDQGVWADARIFLVVGSVERPETIKIPPLAPRGPLPVGLEIEPLPVIAPVDRSPKPAIHGARVVGTTPGKPFMFLIPATGKKPLKFSARNLPAGLKLDEKTGIISGSLKDEGKTVVELTVKGPKGRARRNLTIVGGKNKLALTPPMGWNSWYELGGDVTDQHVRDVADMLVETGLAACGYQYVNIDDCWAGEHNANGRDANGRVTPNGKFPDMKALADYVHSKGLKFGIYSSPGARTCAGFEGSYQHEVQDAMTYAEWGVDFLKYDLCSYTNSDTWKNSKRTIEDQIKPVAIMQEALDNCGRDIVHNFGGWGEVWEWGPKIGLNQWRISRDITPVWHEVKRVMLTQRGAEAYARPGHWNDPDYLMVGNSWFSYNYPSGLTGNEQLFQVTHWSLSAAPLFVSCNMATLDEFTLALLSNHEVIDVDQDPLGIQAKTVYQTGDAEVLARPLHDGTKAVGLFNWGEHPTKITIHWEDLRMKGPQPVRDLWQRKDLGVKKDSFTATVGRHGAVFIKVGKPEPSKF